MYCILLFPGPTARWWQICPYFLTGWVSRLLGLLWYPGLSGLPPCCCLSPFPLPFHISVLFHSLIFTCHWISFVFLLYNWCICNHRSILHLLTFWVSFQAWNWLWYPMLGSQRRSRGALARVWTSDLGILAATKITARPLHTPYL